MISSPAGKVESAPRHHFEGTSYRRRARERAGRPSWKNESDAATYEKQNEGACAAASVLSEAPGAFLHFHPLLHLTRPDRGCPPPCRDPCVPPTHPLTSHLASSLARSRARRPFSTRPSSSLALSLPPPPLPPPARFRCFQPSLASHRRATLRLATCRSLFCILTRF